MGMLIDGVWTQQDTLVDNKGRLQRPATAFRHWITHDGSPGPTGLGGFKAEPGRYHLYIARACPWAHRAAIFRELKGLQAMVGISVTHWLMADNGWTFESGPGVIPDPLHDTKFIWELYRRSDKGHSGRATIPVLWDRETSQIVSNESAHIIRMFNSAFDFVGASPGDYYPEPLRGQIDAFNSRIYDAVNNGVYKAGFARSQEAYDEAITPLFGTLDWLDGLLSQQPFLCGETLTEADWRLFTTLLRFDVVYHGHFKCNVRRLVDYPALWSHTRRLLHIPGVGSTVDFQHIKRHYYQSHHNINPSGIVPAGPMENFAMRSPRSIFPI